MWKVILGLVGVGLLVTNCTIKTEDSCTPGEKKNCNACANGVTGNQTCGDDSTYGECFCPGSVDGGGSNAGGSSVAGGSNGGASSGAGGSSGGASSGGASSGNAGEGGATSGDAGAGGDASVVYASCVDCLSDRCAAEYAACDAEPNCISTELDGSGQFERIAACINAERVKGLVKRDVVRGCGVTMGASADPNYDQWAPTNMHPTTTALMNCMADAPGAAAASWANDDANYPVDSNDMIHPTPWPAGTCAKDACTSAL